MHLQILLETMSTQMTAPAITKGRSCGSSSRSPSNSEHPQIQPPRRRAGEEEKNKMKEKNAKQWKDFNRQAARVFEIRDPDGFRTRAALCLALLLLRRGRETRLRPRPKQRELYEREPSPLLLPL